ncbi:hypothetical protein [Microbacterium sp. NPDC089695]|uniref:hypothetical protein n=1 Tax=Microbacterium sp. NPDC089695 TaxID=3364198 RepID=UPI00382CB8E8
MSLRRRLLGAARAMTGLVPDGLLARVLPGPLRWDQARMRASTPPQEPVRLLIAPTNSAGQAHLWATAAATHLDGVGAVNLMTTNDRTERFAFPADVAVPESGYLFARGWQSRQRRAILEGFSHVLLESGRYLYGPVPWRSPLDVLDGLAARGVRIGLLWHGSDIRVPSAHASWEADSPFGERGAYPASSTAVLEANARERRQMIAESDYPVFVSTPGLLDVPRSQWLPVVVDPERWRSDTPPFSGEVPVVAYVPSNSAMKGDDSVDRQLDVLQREGVIRYRRLEGIPAADMPDVYRSADIVLDQFRLGDYGVAACEAMAAGRVVIGHVHDDVRARVLAQTGAELPIVESRFDRVGETVRELVIDRESARHRAAGGPAFIARVHDGRLSASVLADFLGAAAPTFGLESSHD